MLVIILLQLADEESSYLIGFYYSIVAIILYRHPFTENIESNSENLMITGIIFFSGLRISLLS